MQIDVIESFLKCIVFENHCAAPWLDHLIFISEYCVLPSEVKENFETTLLVITISSLLVLGTEMNKKTLSLFQRASVPLVVLDSLFHHHNVNTVVMNNFEAGYIATKHLLEKGHGRIGLIISSIDFTNMRDRRLGYQAALAERGIAAPEQDMFLVEPTMDGAARDMQALLEARQGDLPTAFFAANDIMDKRISDPMTDSVKSKNLM